MSETLDEHVDRLANYIMAEIDGEPSQSQGAVDTAIRIMQEQKQALKAYPREPETKSRVVIKDGWFDAGRTGTKLGADFFVRQWWTPVLWDDEEDPDFFKTTGLAFFSEESELRGEKLRKALLDRSAQESGELAALLLSAHNALEECLT